MGLSSAPKTRILEPHGFRSDLWNHNLLWGFSSAVVQQTFLVCSRQAAAFEAGQFRASPMMVLFAGDFGKSHTVASIAVEQM